MPRRTLLLDTPQQKGESASELTDMLCSALGIANKTEDKKVFKEIVEKSLRGVGVTSKALSKELKLPRSTVIYKLNYFIESGLVVRKGRQYFLRGSNMEETIQQLEAEVESTFDRLLKLASKLDKLIESELYGK